MAILDTLTYPKPKPLSEIEESVAEYLVSIGAVYKVRFLGSSDLPVWGGDPWEHDSWHVALVCGSRTFKTEFHTGSGNRLRANLPHTLRNASPSCIAIADFRRHYPDKPQAPCAAAVLYSSLRDASGAGETFRSWCMDYGYDTDSRRARDTYDACQIIRDDLYSVLTREQIAHLETLLEDY